MTQIIPLLDNNQLDNDRALEILKDRLTAIELEAQKMIVSASEFTNSLSSDQRTELQQILQKRIQSRHNQHHDGQYLKDQKQES